VSTKDKLIERYKRQPQDFTWEELVKLFNILGFTVDSKGKTSGSRILFENGEDAHTVHKPHPANIIKQYVMKQILKFLTEKGYINEKN
jgi:predicted RNA binding protein YcfA (HicA-like mRNA interferase family)